MEKLVLCVVPNPGGWSIQIPKDGSTLAINRTKYDALEQALAVARSNLPSAIRILRADDVVEDELAFEAPGRS